MGDILQPRPVLPLIAVFSRHESALDWAESRATEAWGPTALCSPRFVFDQTDYYQRSMGEDLRKQLLVFEQLMDPAALAARKILANQLEQRYANEHDHPERRPLNIDPGYVTEAKLVLASTKDRDHRLYLEQGIYAEGTLYFHAGGWRSRPWTYPDYATEGYQEFLTRCRQYLRNRYQERRSD